MIHVDVHVDEDSLEESHKLQSDLQRDRDQIVVEDDECQKIEGEVL